ncbi:hypothetical protein HPB49_013388 [Dermacentor silvarum]|uniref:Uncharacterized protein n=1 Tax=Dermacentor silvarum TaxID=543639 RepID=A0ACB8CFB6_DERSI|nr:hypothetical protein HPB49_013388 [Dermacentor silvarum]
MNAADRRPLPEPHSAVPHVRRRYREQERHLHSASTPLHPRRSPFVIAYTTLTVSVAIPVMQLESVLGQFTGAGNIGIFDTVPGMRGLGHTMTFYFTLGMTIFSLPALGLVLRAHEENGALQQRAGTHNAALPALARGRRGGRSRTARPRCSSPSPSTATSARSAATTVRRALLVSSFDSRVLRLSADGHDVVHPEIAIAMAALWLLVFAATKNGLQNAEYAVYVIASLTITTLILMLVNSLALKYSDRGMNLLVRAPLSGVVSYELWRDALKVTISNIGIFSGGFLSVARFNIFKTKIGTFSTIVALMQLISSLLYGLLFYAHVGFLSSVKDTDIEHILESVDIEHVIMPETLTILDTTRFWCQCISPGC